MFNVMDWLQTKVMYCYHLCNSVVYRLTLEIPSKNDIVTETFIILLITHILISSRRAYAIYVTTTHQVTVCCYKRPIRIKNLAGLWYRCFYRIVINK